MSNWPKPEILLTPEEEAVKEDILREFQEWGYTGLLGWVQKQGHIQIEKMSQQKPGISIDIGCGSGFHFNYVDNGFHVGLDISAFLLKHAKERYGGTNFIQGDAYALPFKRESVDRVISIYNFEHLRRLPHCLTEIQRILKPFGELMVALPAEGGWMYGIGRHLTSKRHFNRKYGINYMNIVKFEVL